eukprot:9850206-Ditylum_brightwellii.AAC.1
MISLNLIQTRLQPLLNEDTLSSSHIFSNQQIVGNAYVDIILARVPPQILAAMAAIADVDTEYITTKWDYLISASREHKN